MRAEAINKKIRVKPLKFMLRDMPHATIETNRTCNIRCRCCYNLYWGHVKSLHQVKDEIDQISRIRNLQAVTLLGGEPTLHPDLCAIVAYIKHKKLICQVLTNGIVFMEDRGNKLLEDLKTAGVDKVLLHIDSGMDHIHRDIELVRERLFSQLEMRRIPFSLAVTIYNEDKGKLAAISKHYSRYRYFDGILAVLARDPLPPRVQNPGLSEEYHTLAAQLNIEPIAYIPSNLDDRWASWLIYLYFINAGSERAFALSPLLNRIFRLVYRAVKGHHLFVIKVNPGYVRIFALLTFLAEIILHPRRITEVVRFIRGRPRGKGIRFHSIAIQTPPELNREQNRLQLCYHCPDATIRDGVLTPVCIADQLHPTAGQHDFCLDEQYRKEVFEHLADGRNKHDSRKASHN